MLYMKVNDDKNCVDVYCDNEGLNTLKHYIDRLIKAEAPEHEHLFSDEWGGYDLDAPAEASNIIHKLTILKMKD